MYRGIDNKPKRKYLTSGIKFVIYLQLGYKLEDVEKLVSAGTKPKRLLSKKAGPFGGVTFKI